MVEEKLTGTHEPERGIYEPAYQAELKKRATELTGNFAEALKRSPEFTKHLLMHIGIK